MYLFHMIVIRLSYGRQGNSKAKVTVYMREVALRWIVAGLIQWSKRKVGQLI